MLGTSKPKTLAIGDSLRTDISGAKAAHIDSCWILSGIDAQSPATAPQTAATANLSPTAILPAFTW